jgi:hypothetical protein
LQAGLPDISLFNFQHPHYTGIGEQVNFFRIDRLDEPSATAANVQTPCRRRHKLCPLSGS